METALLAAIEGQIRGRFDTGDRRGAVAIGVASYGPEVLGLLVSVLRDDQRAREAFADWSEDVCRGIDGFRWESSFRTWAYALARHAWIRRGAREPRHVPLSDAPEALEIEDRPRTPTAPYRRTDVKRRVARLRAELGAEEQELLVLRIDRGMSWAEIAAVVRGVRPRVRKRTDEADVAALRKRFERIKDRLRALAAQDSLLEGERAET